MDDGELHAVFAAKVRAFLLWMNDASEMRLSKAFQSYPGHCILSSSSYFRREANDMNAVFPCPVSLAKSSVMLGREAAVERWNRSVHGLSFPTTRQFAEKGGENASFMQENKKDELEKILIVVTSLKNSESEVAPSGRGGSLGLSVS